MIQIESKMSDIDLLIKYNQSEIQKEVGKMEGRL